jgi:subfamily B ATP-binding cassette protein MsbA
MSPRGSLPRLLGFLRPYRGLVSIAVAVTLLASVVALAIPWFGRSALDRVVATRATADVNHAFLVLGLLWLVAAALNLARDVLTNRLGHRIVTDLRQKVIVHALQLPVTYFDRARLGDLMSLLTTDSEQLRRTMTEDPIRAVGDLAMVIGGAALLLTLDWRLTTALMAVGLAVPVGHRWLSPQLRSLNRATLDAASSALSRTGEAMSNLRLVKSFGRERHEASIAENSLESVFKAATRASRFESLVWTGVYAAFGLVALAVIWYGVLGVVSGQVSLGTMLAYFYTLTIVAAPLTSVAGVAARAQRAGAAADRVYEILDRPPEANDPSGAPDLHVTRGEVEFVEVGFAYEPGEPVLSGFTLQIPAGNTMALVGATGAGKSTVMWLLQRFYEPMCGNILIDGVSIATVTRRSLRGAFAVVPQEALLFEGSIRENIRYGRLEASNLEVERAATAAHVDEFAARLEAGLDTNIGERGVRLSGGQRQRIAIARAILRNAPILLLDEATSSLDAQSESLVQDALRTVMAGRTTLVIAHRQRTVESADRIAVLDGGRIVAVGTHAELTEKSERYRHLFTSSVSAGEVGA